jgi:hypothetical protein
MGVQHIIHVIIGGVSPAPGEEAMIFQSVQGLTLIALAQPLTSLPKHQGYIGNVRIAPPSARGPGLIRARLAGAFAAFSRDTQTARLDR